MLRKVPASGTPELTADEDLVAVWRSQHGMPFQNYWAGRISALDHSRAALVVT